MTLQNYLCGYVAELLNTIGDLPNVEWEKLSPRESYKIASIRGAISTASIYTEELKAYMKGEENEQAPVS